MSFAKSNKYTQTIENDNIYLNVVIDFINNYITPTQINESDQNAEYSVTKTQPILDKCSDYYCSVIRFDIPLDLVPLYIMPIVPASPGINPQTNSDLTPMIIGISYLGVDYPVSVIYVPDNTETPPSQNQVGRQVITSYYFVYTYNNLVQAFNTALTAAYIAAGKPGYVGLPENDPGAPFITYNADDQTINFIVSQFFINSGATIFCNESSINYLDAIRAKFLGYNQPNGKDFVFNFNIYPGGNNLYTGPNTFLPGTGNYYIFKSEYNTLVFWSSLRKIIIATNTIPVKNEYVPSYNQNGSQNGVTTSFPILTDFVPHLETGGQSRSIAYYVPTGQYRLIDMQSDNPLYNINIKLYWEDKQGDLYPIEISTQQEANVKLAFLRKTLYKPSNLLTR